MALEEETFDRRNKATEAKQSRAEQQQRRRFSGTTSIKQRQLCLCLSLLIGLQ
jgi:hypothetical protein